MRGWSTALAVACIVAVGGVAAAERVLDVDWRKVATKQDRGRLRNWREAWIEALGKARTAPDAAAAIAADRALFDPDRIPQGVALKPGSYRCRMHRLGGVGAAGRPLLRGAWTPCRVSEDGTTARLVTDGEQRISGNLFDGTDARTVFLGTLALGDEVRSFRYGRDARRDMAGLVERIDEARWRLVLPFPGFQSTLDVMEIVRV